MRGEERGSALVMVMAIVFVLCLALLLVPFFAKVSAARAEQQAVADQTALAGANAIARAKTSLLIIDSIDYKFSEYIATTTVLLACLAALTLVPYAGEVAGALIEPVGDLLQKLVTWKRSFDEKVGDPARIGIRKIAPVYAMTLSTRIAAANGYVGTAVPYPFSSKAGNSGAPSVAGEPQDSLFPSEELNRASKELGQVDRQVAACIRRTSGPAGAIDRSFARLPDSGDRELAQSVRQKAIKLSEDVRHYSESVASIVGDGGITELDGDSARKALAYEAIVGKDIGELVQSLEQWQGEDVEPDVGMRLSALRSARDTLAGLLARRAELLKECRRLSGELNDVSDNQRRGLAQAKTQLMDSARDKTLPGSHGVIALVYKSGGLSSGSGRAVRPLALAAAVPLENPRHELDLWGDTELVGDSKIGAGITEVAKMIRAADKLLGWARLLGDTVLSLIGSEPPKAYAFEPVLVNSAYVDSVDGADGLVAKLHRRRNSLYRKAYIPVEKVAGLAGEADVRGRKWPSAVVGAAKDYWGALRPSLDRLLGGE